MSPDEAFSFAFCIAFGASAGVGIAWVAVMFLCAVTGIERGER